MQKTIKTVRIVVAGCLSATLTLVAGAGSFDDGKGLFNRRLGLFIHWGIYSVDGYHEQQRMRQGMCRAEYEKRAESFTAEKFDADKFVDAAESLGAAYIVLTAKHHDGFCMWDTATTDFKVTKTPAKRDVVGELSAACKRRGMKLGLYYSNPDWHHPNAYNPLSTHQVPPEPGDDPNMEKYRKYVKAQITELLTKYGEIVCLFWDIPTKIAAPEMNELVRRLQPGILINDRGWGEKGDYSTPERNVPEGSAFETLTEACDSVGVQSWGYRRTEDYRTVDSLTRSIDSVLTRGGNYLLNVGPKTDGTIPSEALDVLRRTGDWYRKVRESFCDMTTEPNLPKADGVLVTRRGETIYLHCSKGLSASGVDARPLAKLPKKATLLNAGAVLQAELTVLPSEWKNAEVTLHVYGIPTGRLSGEAAVIRLDF